MSSKAGRERQHWKQRKWGGAVQAGMREAWKVNGRGNEQSEGLTARGVEPAETSY